MDGRMLSTWRCFTGHGSPVGSLFFWSIPTGNHIFFYPFPKSVILPCLPLVLSVAVFNPVSGTVPVLPPGPPVCVHPVFGYLCVWPLSDGRPSGLPSELLIGRCKSLSPSRDRANGHTLRCLLSLRDTFRCPFRWPVLTMFNKTVKNVSVHPLFREQLPNLSVRSVPIRCSTGSIPMRFLRKNCGDFPYFLRKNCGPKLRFFSSFHGNARGRPRGRINTCPKATPRKAGPGGRLFLEKKKDM